MATGQIDVSLPTGEIRWLAANEHSGANIGSTDTVTVFIELKEPAPDRGQAQLGPRS